MRQKWTENVRAFLSFSLLLLSASCNDAIKEGMPVEAHEVGFYAGGAQTRTEMLSDGLSAVWSANDELALWALNSSGVYTLSNQKFIAYGLDAGRGFFTSTLSERMPDDTYIYTCCYPVPVSVSGTKVTFAVPAVQDGKASSGADIMISDPVRHGPLAALPEVEDYSGMSMRMNRMMHQFRFFIPLTSSAALSSEKIERIKIDFPSSVAGNVTFDMENPDAAPVLSDATGSMEIRLAEPLGISSDTDIAYACLAFVPKQFASGQSMQITAYTTSSKIAYFDPVDLKGRNFLAGHSTPVKLNVKGLGEYPYSLSFNISANNLGEDVDEVRIAAPAGCAWPDGNTGEYIYTGSGKITTGEKIVVRFESKEAYEKFSGKQATVIYESEHAIVSQTVNMGTVVAESDKDETVVNLTVPYLFYEDFSSITDFNFDVVTGAQGTAVTGYELSVANSSKDNVNPGLRQGWTGARTGGGAGQSIRVGARVDRVWGYTHTYGRLDSPTLGCLKPGASVRISVSFNYSGGRDGDSGYSPRAVVGTTTTTGAINGKTGSFSSDEDGWTNISDYSLIPSISTGGSYGNVNQSMTYILDDCTNSNRISWQIRGTGKGEIISNGNQWMFIDNIKVQIEN